MKFTIIFLGFFPCLLFSQSRYTMEGVDPFFPSSRNILERKRACLNGDTFYKNWYKYPRKDNKELKYKKLGKCFATQLRKEKISSKKIKKDLELFNDNHPELLNYLAGFNDINYNTGNEELLKEWVLKQVDNSINPLFILQTSLNLNNSHLPYALLTIHELLRSEARYYMGYTPGYFSNRKAKSAFFNKFIDIRGDLEEKCDGVSRGDHSGGWYRIWGAMLHALSLSKFKNNNKPSTWSAFNTFISGLFMSQASEVSKITQEWKEPDRRKAYINMGGYQAVISMIRNLHTQEASSSCKVEQYIE